MNDLRYRLKKIRDSYNDFVEAMINYASFSTNRKERLCDYLYWLTLFVADQPDSQTQFQYIYFIKNGN